MELQGRLDYLLGDLAHLLPHRLVRGPEAPPPAIAGRCRSEHTHHRRRIAHVTGEHRIDRCVQIDPDLGKVGLLSLAGACPTLRQSSDPACEVAPELLRGTARGVEEVNQHMPVARLDSRLFGELALRSDKRGLARYVAQAGRQLEQKAADGIAVLADEKKAIALVEGGDSYRSGVHDKVAGDDRSPGQAHVIPRHRPDVSRESLLARDQLSRMRLIAHRSAPLTIDHD